MHCKWVCTLGDVVVAAGGGSAGNAGGIERSVLLGGGGKRCNSKWSSADAALADKQDAELGVGVFICGASGVHGDSENGIHGR